LADPGVAAGDDGFLALELTGWLVEFRAAFPVWDVFDGGLRVEFALLLAGRGLLLDWGLPACLVVSASGLVGRVSRRKAVTGLEH